MFSGENKRLDMKKLEADKAKAMKKYRNELGWKLVEHEFWGIKVNALRYGYVLITRPPLEPAPSYRYFYQTSDIATSFEIPELRLSHAIRRTKPGKPYNANNEAGECLELYSNVYYQGKLYLRDSIVSEILKDLAHRRPYLNTLRTVYAEYLAEHKPKASSYFGRQGVVKE
ncbi:hypothetical protein AMR41_14295 [Hapalosiphon sp. MRB220]|nr:hypothetical protein AMR41_14295 [Hapalosiphon sp. MRB220]